jgi:hypothetical protein
LSLQNDRELKNTREKLRLLEEDYETVRADTAEDPELREMTMESLQTLIKQFKEEILRYETRQAIRG